MSCSDVQTIKAGNGSQLTFSFDFPYIFKSEIHVYFWNATTKEWDEKLTTDSTHPWRITDANPTIVEFTGTAPPSPATPSDPGEPTVDNVKIRRITKVDDIRALFNPGSAIRSDDLNKNFEQLRYAIQESNCQGIPDDVDQYLKDYYWDRYDNTLYNGDTWVSDDTKIATTAALDARFQDEVNDTFTKAELAAASNIMPNDDVAVPTTGALDDYINEVITNDIGSSDGVTITDDGDGTITVGLADNSVDFDKIKDADQIQLADQIADPDAEGTDNNIFTAKAATRRFNNYYQNEAPTATAGIGEGQVWVDPNDDLTLSVWSGSAWVGITSGGTFTNQPKVVYVDASSGDDANDGHRISRPKQSIKAAVTQINADDTHGNGSIVVVAPGVYQEACPIQIQKRDVAIVGTSVRNCVVHPTPATETATMFEVNSGTYLKNLTFTGMKASGTRGASGSLWEDATHGLPPTQGWNVAFFDDAMIYKSPYVQNCTNFSDSEIDNSDLDFYAGDENKGRAGDLDSAPTGGGLLIDGSTPHADSPLRSIVCDSYTHTGLDAPGIFVTNNGYCQATSSYAFFNHAHITCINGGQANLAASTTDFGRFGLIASGKSTSAIFTSTIDGAVSDGAISFNIDAPTAASGWHGSATRPQGNMLVTVNSVTYPILSATANGSGWTVTISRPNPSNRSENLGVNGAISDGAAVSFFLRSMIASSGHTMEYVGSGTDYRALPGNGGVPVDANQKVELDNGKIWTATTDQNGKFTIGGNQTDDPFFEVDQQLGFVTIPEGSIAFNLLSDLTPQLGGNLDVNSNTITGLPTTPTSATEATSKAYVDAQIAGIDEVVEDTTPQLGGDLDVNGQSIVSNSNGDITLNPNGTGDIVLDASVGIGTASPATTFVVEKSDASSTTAHILVNNSESSSGVSLVGAGASFSVSGWPGITDAGIIRSSAGSSNGLALHSPSGFTSFWRGTGTAAESMRIDSSGRVAIGQSTANDKLHVAGNIRAAHDAGGRLVLEDSNQADSSTPFYLFASTGGVLTFTSANRNGTGGTTGSTERMRIDSSGNVGIGTTSPTSRIHALSGASDNPHFYFKSTVSTGTDNSGDLFKIEHSRGTGNDSALLNVLNSAGSVLYVEGTGNVGIGTTSPLRALTIAKTGSEISGTGNSFGFSINPLTNGYVFLDAVTGGSANTSLSLRTYNNGTYTQAIQSISGNETTFETAGTERMRIDSSGRLLVGSSSSRANGYGDNGSLQLEGTNYQNAAISTILNSGNANGPSLNFAKTRGSNGSSTIVQSGDNLGVINFSGGDGTDIKSAGARIRAQVDGTPGSNDMPGRITFETTPDGSTSPTERMRIASDGKVGIGHTTPQFGLTLAQSSNDTGALGWEDGSNNKRASIRCETSGDSLQFRTGSSDTERMRIDNSGRVSIGTSAPMTDAILTLAGGTEVALGFKRTDSAKFDAGIRTSGGSMMFHTGSDSTTVGGIPERMRIDGSGNVLTATTSTTVAALSSAGTGHRVSPSGIILQVASNAFQTAAFNRTNTDGSVIGIRHNGAEEGTISVSGSTVSYNGAHLSRWSQLAGGAERIEILRGSVLSNLDEMCEWGEEDNEQLNRMKVSDVEGDPNVSGVFQAWDDDDDTYINDFYCAMTGDFVIRIAQGTTVARGDLLMSAGDGTAKPQDDDIVRSKTIAKVTSTTVSTTYSDGSYCVPCVLMAC